MRKADDLEELCSKKVSQYDRSHSLALPTRLIDHVWPTNLEGVPERVRKFQVVDLYDQSWTFEGHLRRGNSDGYPRPEVRGPGWRDFIRNKGLRVGDKLIFYRPPPIDVDLDFNRPPLVFVVSVMREIKLAGETMIGHVAPEPPNND